MRGALSSLLEFCCIVGCFLYAAFTVVLEVSIANQSKASGSLAAQSASGVIEDKTVGRPLLLAEVPDPTAARVAVTCKKRRRATADHDSVVPVFKRRCRPKVVL
ncbi:unnamed protein product [Linum trigynum]|uniref:Secreted protein n=1 Tax=Linum trigynum TaxID=586398 RepID=A0AAV2FEL2_9ROSI